MGKGRVQGEDGIGKEGKRGGKRQRERVRVEVLNNKGQQVVGWLDGMRWEEDHLHEVCFQVL